jgi:hypothetical protein
MKYFQWQQYLTEQSQVHDKSIYSIAELANVAKTTGQALNVEIQRLGKKGLIVQYAHGIYGLKDLVTPESLVPCLDKTAYITSASALFHHGFITQVPMTFTCFTNRRKNRSRNRLTPLGRFEFVCVKKPIYSPPLKGIIAEPEQALFDFVYLMRRSAVDPETIVSFRKLDEFRPSRLAKIARRYPSTVRKQIAHILRRKMESEKG